MMTPLEQKLLELDGQQAKNASTLRGLEDETNAIIVSIQTANTKKQYAELGIFTRLATLNSFKEKLSQCKLSLAKMDKDITAEELSCELLRIELRAKSRKLVKSSKRLRLFFEDCHCSVSLKRKPLLDSLRTPLKRPRDEELQIKQEHSPSGDSFNGCYLFSSFIRSVPHTLPRIGSATPIGATLTAADIEFH
jgi:hypothetical protein